MKQYQLRKLVEENIHLYSSNELDTFESTFHLSIYDEIKEELSDITNEQSNKIKNLKIINMKLNAGIDLNTNDIKLISE